MIIAFGSARLRRLCEEPELANSEFGQVIADSLRARLADLRAAVSFADLPVGKPFVRGALRRELAIDLTDGAQIVVQANHKSPPLDATGEIDWTRVSYVQVRGIERA